MLGDESTKSREAEHLAFGVVGLYQAVAVEEGAVASIEHDLVLLVVHAQHKAQGHPSRSELLGVVASPHIGQVMSSVCVPQATALGVEDTIEAGDKHVGWYVYDQRVIDPSQYLPRRVVRGLGDGT